MITLLACWVLIAFSAVMLGHGLLVVVNCDRDDRVGNWLVQTLWLGLVAWGWLAAVVSLVAPVTPWSVALTVGVCCILALAASGRSLGNRLFQFIRLDMMMALAVIIGCAAFVAANLRPTPDTGGLHFSAIPRLAGWGSATPGAPISHPFGFFFPPPAVLAPLFTGVGRPPFRGV